MSHAHNNKIRTGVFVIASVALIATALFAQKSAQAPAPSPEELEMLFRTSVLPQPETHCKVERYNAKGGVLAKPQLVCTLNMKEVVRSLPDLAAGTDAESPAYYVVARLDDDRVLLASGLEDENGPPPDPQFWFYSFKTWKLVPFKAATDMLDAWGWAHMSVSPDGQRLVWAPAHQEGFARTLYLTDLSTQTIKEVLKVSPPESLSTPSDITPYERLGWKDAHTIVYGVWNEFDLIAIREVTVD